MDPLVLWELLAPQVDQDQLELRGNQGRLEIRDPLGRKDSPECLVCLELLVPPDHRDRRDLREPQDLRVLRDRMDRLAIRVRPVHREAPAQVVSRDSRDNRE